MAAEMFKKIFLTILVLLVLLIVGTTVWLNSWPYTYFFVIICVLIFVLFMGIFISQHINLRAQMFIHLLMSKNIISIVKSFWYEYLFVRKCNSYLKKINKKLEESNGNLNLRNVYLVFGGRTNEGAYLLGCNGGFIIEVTDSCEAFKCWDVNRNIYIEMMSNEVSDKNISDGRRNLILTKQIKKYTLNNDIKAFVVLSSYKMVLDFKKPHNLSSIKAINENINIIHRALNDVIPIQIVITECHALNGYSQFCMNSNMQFKHSTVGFSAPVNDRYEQNAGFLNDAFQSIFNTLCKVRLSLPNQEKAMINWSAMYLIPEQIVGIKNEVVSYIDALINGVGSNKRSALIGLHFSLGDVRLSNDLKNEIEIQNNGNPQAVSTNCFDDKIFSSIIPNSNQTQRVFVSNIKKYKFAKRIISYMLPSVYALLCILTTLIFFRNYQNINYLSDVDRRYTSSVNQLTDSRELINIFGNKITSFNRSFNQSNIPTFGFNHTENYIQKLKYQYVDLFQEKILNQANVYLDRSLDLIMDVPDIRLVSQHVRFLRNRIKCIKNIKATKHEFEVEDNFACRGILNPHNYINWSNDDAELQNGFKRYVRWQSNHLVTAGMIAADQKRLYQLVFMNHQDDGWILNSVADISAESGMIMSRELLAPILSDEINSLQINNAYTIFGRETILGFLNDVGESYASDYKYIKGYSPKFSTDYDFQGNEFDIHYANYIRNYNENYLTAWEAYLKIFSNGFSVTYPSEYKKLVKTISNNNSAYEKLVITSYRQLLPIRDSMVLNDEAIPEWLSDVMNLGYMLSKRNSNENSMSIAGLSTLHRIDSDMRSPSSINGFLHQAKSVLGYQDNFTENPKHKVSSSEYAQLYTKYTNKLALIYDTSKSPDEAFKLLREYVETGQQLNKMGLVAEATYLLKTIVGKYFNPRVILDDVLIRAQYSDVMYFLFRQSELYVQKRWGILQELNSVNTTNALTKLKTVRRNGEFWAFYRNISAMFLMKKPPYQYQRMNIVGQTFRFTDSYLRTLVIAEKLNGLKNEAFSFNIDTIPAEARTQRKALPIETKLTFICDSKEIVITNRNYHLTKKVLLNPLTCTEINIQIVLDSVVLQKKYVGEWCYFDFRKKIVNRFLTLPISELDVISGHLPENNLIDIVTGFSLREIDNISALESLRTIMFPKNIVDVTSL